MDILVCTLTPFPYYYCQEHCTMCSFIFVLAHTVVKDRSSLILPLLHELVFISSVIARVTILGTLG